MLILSIQQLLIQQVFMKNGLWHKEQHAFTLSVIFVSPKLPCCPILMRLRAYVFLIGTVMLHVSVHTVFRCSHFISSWWLYFHTFTLGTYLEPYSHFHVTTLPRVWSWWCSCLAPEEVFLFNVVAIVGLCFFSHYFYFLLIITTDQGRHETASTCWVGLALPTTMVKQPCCSAVRLFIHTALTQPTSLPVHQKQHKLGKPCRIITNTHKHEKILQLSTIFLNTTIK